jgi:hypothetical protein
MPPAAFFAAVALLALSIPPNADSSKQQQASPKQPPISTERASRTDDPALAADLAILAKLDEPLATPQSFRSADAGAVVEAMRVATGLPIEIDHAIVGESGGWELARVSCDAVTPRVALDAVARAISTGYRVMELDVVAGIAIFTDSARASRITSIRRYDLGPVLRRMDRRDEPAAELARGVARMVIDAIDREGWRDNGGEVSWLQAVDQTLVVSTTPARHHGIGRFLDGLARSLPEPAIRWTIRIADIRADVADADLALALDSARELDALISLGGASLRSRPVLLALRHDGASIEIGQASERGAKSVALAIDVKPVIGSTSYAVTVRESSTDGSRTLSLRALEGIRSAGFIEAGGKRLLVEVLGVDVLGIDVLGIDSPPPPDATDDTSSEEPRADRTSLPQGDASQRP